MPKYLLGVDNGSSMIRAGLYRYDGYTVAAERIETNPASYEPGYYQSDLELIFQKTASVIKQVIERSGVDSEDITAISFTGHGNGLYLVDEHGRAAFDGISNIDKRAKSIVDNWDEVGISKRVEAISLQHLWAGQQPALIKWFDRNRADILDKSRWVLHIKDYIRFRMCGHIAMDETGFSMTSLYDPVARKCSDEIFEVLGISKYRKLIPPLIGPVDICGDGVIKNAADQTGLKVGTPVVSGLSGPSAIALASGLVDQSGDKSKYLNLYLGTWSNNQFLTNNIKDGKGMFMTSVHPVQGYWMVSQMSATSSRNILWFVENFLKGEKEEAEKHGQCIFDICDKAVANTSPSGSNVIFLPYLYDSIETTNIKGALFNIQTGDNKDSIIRAIYEGILFSHRKNIQELLPDLPIDIVIRASGGNGSSREWWQMLSDIMGRPVEVTEVIESRTLGAAMCAGVGVGVFEDFRDAAEKMVHIKKRYQPNRAVKTVYDNKYNLYLDFLEKFA